MKTEANMSAAPLNRRYKLTTILFAAAAGIAGVAVSARKATIIYAGTEQIGRNIETIRMISQISAAIATLIFAFTVILLTGVTNIEGKADRIVCLRRYNITALIAAPMIDILILIGASELIQAPMQAKIPSDSSLTTICSIVGVIDAFMAHAVLGALAISFISFRRILHGSKEAPEHGKALRLLVVCSAAVQIIVSVLCSVCAVNALAGSKTAAEAVYSCVHSLAFAVLTVIFVRCWQRLAINCEALVADEQPEHGSCTSKRI